MGYVSYLDSGPSLHMTEKKEIFNNFEQKDLKIHINMGGDGWYKATVIGIVTFKSDSCKTLPLKYFMYVPSLKNNFFMFLCWKTVAMMSYSVKERCSMFKNPRDM